MKKIKTDYDKVINESNEKIHIAEDCYGWVKVVVPCRILVKFSRDSGRAPFTRNFMTED